MKRLITSPDSAEQGVDFRHPVADGNLLRTLRFTGVAIHAGASACVVTLQVVLEIQPETSRVPIRASPDGERACRC